MVSVKMTALVPKEKELLQAMRELRRQIHKEPGCLGSRLYKDLDQQQGFTFIGEWATPTDAARHLQSDLFSVLRGALQLLAQSAEVTFFTQRNVFKRRKCDESSDCRR